MSEGKADLNALNEVLAKKGKELTEADIETTIVYLRSQRAKFALEEIEKAQKPKKEKKEKTEKAGKDYSGIDVDLASLGF